METHRLELDRKLREMARRMAMDNGEDCFGEAGFLADLHYAAILALREAGSRWRLEAKIDDDPCDWLRARADEIEKQK